MAGSFVAKASELQQKVGRGDLTMKLTVHQPYAAAEHVRYYYKHPRGGEAGYVEQPLNARVPEMLEKLASGALTNIRGAAIEAVQVFESIVQSNAPVMFDTLRNSCNLDVFDNGATIYHKEQTAPFRYDKE